MNQDGESFHDISALSGLDSEADGRGIALFDYDRDGWQDIVVVNANSPQLEIFHNRIQSKNLGGQSIAFRLVGGKQDAKPGGNWSNRDGVGAIITLQVAGKTLMREFRCGEGFAAQNSNTVLIGLGESELVEVAEISWPSGKKLKFEKLKSGFVYTAFETGELHHEAFRSTTLPTVPEEQTLASIGLSNLPNDKPMIFVTTATWCSSCKKNLPQVALLKEKFGEHFHFFGLPVDPDNTADDLKLYDEVFQPAYKILDELPVDSRKRISGLTASLLGEEVLPSTIVTNALGEVIAVRKGVPTISEFIKITAKLEKKN